jgi:ATP-binding cassette subfamily B protein/ATP-binding cassette subfamily C protein
VKLSLKQYQTLLVTYLKPLWPQALQLGVLLLVNTGLQLLSPQLLAAFIDAAMAGTAWTGLIWLALFFLGVALLTQLISVVESYQATNIGLTATNRLRADLALHCLQLDMSFHNRRTPGELIERIDGDVGHLANFFSRFAVELLGSLLLLLGVFVVLFWLDWRVGATLGLFALLTLLAINGLRNVAVPHFKQVREASAALFGFLEERLAGTEDIRSSGATAYVMRRFYEHARAQLRAQLKAVVIGLSAFNLSNVLFALGTIIALGLGIYLFQQGSVTIGTVYLIYRYAELIHRPIQQINRQMQDLQQAGAAIIRIQELLSTQSQLQETGQAGLPAQPLAVEFDRVSFGYSDNGQAGAPAELAMRDLSFNLPPQTVLGLLGRTGSGKTTLTRLLFRLYDPKGGTIRLSGLALPELSLAELHRRVAMVTQEIQLFHASVRDNLTLFDPHIPDERIIQALAELGLDDWYAKLPQGLDTVLPPGGGGLSAGEAQLLAFVRVFLRDPGLVILDEASSRLDPATEQRLEQAIDRLLAGRTAIIIAHRLATVRRADCIMILENGRCIEYGPRRQLAADPGSLFARLLQTGLEEALA